jgi:enoyl-CoA hydratase/carnithine racemase
MTIRFVVENHVARVTIDRPDRMNAIDEASEAELMRIWSAIERNEQVRCVVLTGAGERAFCTGADMKQSGNKTGLEYWAAARPGGFGGLALRETLDVPVIARVNGHALGGGMEMVLGCDIVSPPRMPASACPSRASAGWRSTAASPSCRGVSRTSGRWACC